MTISNIELIKKAIENSNWLLKEFDELQDIVKDAYKRGIKDKNEEVINLGKKTLDEFERKKDKIRLETQKYKKMLSDRE